jgi:PAS domain-containing protein
MLVAGLRISITFGLLFSIGFTTTRADETQFFRESVEPLLKRRCYECHSHSGSEISGGLVLDWKSGWQKGGDRGPAIIPGDPENSLVIKAIRHSDADLKMPEEKLSDEEIAVLVEWIQQGAADPRDVEPQKPDLKDAADWWSLKPLTRPEIPASAGATDSQHPIDRFILEKLRANGLTPSAQADRRTLIRRLSIDLHGLHPSIEDVDAFVNDPAPDAYERLVDRMLESPRYGERWARHWMDTIHYADTHGYEHDVLRKNAWRYRDYLIQSLNEDKPWDRFIREQLAADALYPEETHLMPALGFIGAGTYDHSAAATAVNAFENLDRDDMVTQTMSAFVSTTANCARCHQHKFDPISQEDYYSLQAVFAGLGKGDITFDADASVGRTRRHWLTLKDAADRKDASILLQPEHQALVAKWMNQRGPEANWQPLDIEAFVSVDAAMLVRQPDGSILSTGPRPDKETTTVTCSTTLKSVTALRLDVLTDPSLPMSGPGRMDNGNLHLTEFVVQVFSANSPEPKQLAFRRATADFDQSGWTASHAIDGNLTTAWGIHPQVGQPHLIVFELAEPLAVEPGMKLSVLMRQIHGGGHIIGRFSLSATDSDAELTAVVPLEINQILKLESDQRSPDQKLMLAAHVVNQLASEELQKLPEPAKLYAAGTRAENERGVITFAAPRTIHVLRRGDLDKPGAEVGTGALSAVTALPARFEIPAGAHESQRRAALAEWIAHRDNPLTWRSIANRTWHYHFGRGLCDTPSDFGRMGGVPSHPELLEWLSIWFRDDAKSSLKSLHRLIVTSETWKQSSAHRDDAALVDTDNRLLWKMNRYRLDADSIRDAVLVVSGQLDLTTGGPGVAHFLSSPGPQLTPVLDYDSFDWSTPGATRRSIYRIVWRSIQDPFMEALDFPDLGHLSPVRGFSSSPLQSLVLWNNHFMLHFAEKFAAHVETTGSTSQQHVVAAIRSCWLREPTNEELSVLEELSSSGGLTSVCRALLNSNEFLFVD